MPPITRILFYDSMFDLLFNLSYFFSGLFTRPEYISYSLYDEKLDTYSYLSNKRVGLNKWVGWKFLPTRSAGELDGIFNLFHENQ